MNRVALSSLSFLNLVLAVVACAPVDHVVASNQVGAAGSGVGVGGDQGQGAKGGATSPNSTTTQAQGGGSSSTIQPVFPMGGDNNLGGSSPGTSDLVYPFAGAPTQPSTSPSCMDLRNTTVGARSIEVTIKNERATPIYVGNRESDCLNDNTLRLFEASSGRELTVDTSAKCSCDQVMDHGSCPAYACLRSPLVLLEPNTLMVLNWNGVVANQRWLPNECANETTRGLACSQIQPPLPGRYRLSVTGSTQYGCDTGVDPTVCSCMATNTCGQYGNQPLEGKGLLLEPSVEFDLSSTDKVTLSFTEDLGVLPKKDGVPIGNCTERTPAEQTALGCPVEKPTPGNACSTPTGVACRYGIDVLGNTMSTESVFLCSDGQWGPGSVEKCGQICDFVGSNLIEFQGLDCGARPISKCSELTNTTYAFEPAAQSELDSVLIEALRTCLGTPYIGSANLEVINGCATRLVTGASFSAEVTECLRKTFEPVRLDCARQLTCSGFTSTYI